MKHKTLLDLKALAEQFEELLGDSQDKSQLCTASYEVFHKSKSVLDFSVRQLKTKFPEAIDTTYFPYIQETREKLVTKFEDMKFTNISEKFPDIIDFIFSAIQPLWVKTFINIRNKKVYCHQLTSVSNVICFGRSMKILKACF